MMVCADPRAFLRRRIENAVLIRGEAASAVHARLQRFSRGSLVHPRGALVADVDEQFSVLSVHLGLRGPERGRHIRQLVDMLGGSSGSFVIGGDLNALPGDPGPSAIALLATDSWASVGEGSGATFPSRDPRERIDYLFAGPAVQPLRAWTAGGTVSDHLMVVADLRLKG
jgi:endonuclease/exonuclease/phosphatase family metal-dependent hydrolase